MIIVATNLLSHKNAQNHLVRMIDSIFYWFEGIGYLVIYSTLKKLYNNGTISREAFERLNSKNAEIQGCKPLVI